MNKKKKFDQIIYKKTIVIRNGKTLWLWKDRQVRLQLTACDHGLKVSTSKDVKKLSNILSTSEYKPDHVRKITMLIFRSWVSLFVVEPELKINSAYFFILDLLFYFIFLLLFILYSILLCFLLLSYYVLYILLLIYPHLNMLQKLKKFLLLWLYRGFIS